MDQNTNVAIEMTQASDVIFDALKDLQVSNMSKVLGAFFLNASILHGNDYEKQEYLKCASEVWDIVFEFNKKLAEKKHSF